MKTSYWSIGVICSVFVAILQNTQAESPGSEASPPVFGLEADGAAVAITPLSPSYKLNEPFSVRLLVRNEDTNRDLSVSFGTFSLPGDVVPLLFDSAGHPVPRTWPRDPKMMGSRATSHPKPGNMVSGEHTFPTIWSPDRPGTYRLVVRLRAEWYSNGNYVGVSHLFSNMIEINVVAETEAQP